MAIEEESLRLAERDQERMSGLRSSNAVTESEYDQIARRRADAAAERPVTAQFAERAPRPAAGAGREPAAKQAAWGRRNWTSIAPCFERRLIAA